MQWKINATVNSAKYSPIELIYDLPLKDLSANKLLSVAQEDINLETYHVNAVGMLSRIYQKRVRKGNKDLI